MVEEPLREACKIFKNKGIETVMSSANKENVLEKGIRPLEKEDVKEKEFLLNAPTFNDAGKGYAWIMINYDNLSTENQELLFSLEQTKNSNGDNIGEKMVWFVSAFSFPILNWKTGYQTDEENNSVKRFEERSFTLHYNNRYPERVVILRMPINEEITLIEVENYFVKLANYFRKQELVKDSLMEKESGIPK